MNKLQGPSRIALPLAFAAALGLVFLSWSRYLLTGSLKVDQNYLTEYAVPIIIVSAICIMAFFALMHTAEKYSPWHIIGLMVVFSGMAPFLSNDIFSLWAYGESWVDGNDPYSGFTGAEHAYFYDYVGSKYRNPPCVYGPLALFVSAFSVWAGGEDPLWNLAATKILFLVMGIISLGICLYIAKGNNSLTAAVQWGFINPIVLVEGFGQQHTDVLGFLVIFPALLCWIKGKNILTALLLSTTFAIKITFVFLLPLLLLNYNETGKIRWKSLKEIIVSVLVFSGTLFLWHLPFAPEFHSILAPFAVVSDLRPSGTFEDMFGEIIRLLGNDEARAIFWKWMKLLVPLFCLVIMVKIFLQLRSKKFKHVDMLQLLLIAGTLLITVYSHRFFSWYLITLVPLVGLYGKDYWKSWMIWVGVFATLQGLMHLQEEGSAISVIVVAFTTFACVMLNFLYFRRRLWTLDSN